MENERKEKGMKAKAKRWLGMAWELAKTAACAFLCAEALHDPSEGVCIGYLDDRDGGNPRVHGN